MRTYPHKQRGQVVLITILALTALLSAVGLAIDSGMAYLTRARLNMAVDSAALAAARAVTQGDTEALQRANAERAAQNFFNANFPQDAAMAKPVYVQPTIVFERGKVTIDMAVRGDMPVALLGWNGQGAAGVHASSQTTRKDLDMVLVMDNSGSLSGSGTAVISSAKLFLDRFNPTTDRVGLVRFAYGAVVDDPIEISKRGFARDTLKTHIGKYTFSGSTNSAEGFWQGKAQLDRIASLNRSSLRVLVFFSDGSPNSFSSYLPFKKASDCGSAGTVATDDDTSSDWPKGLYNIGLMSDDLGGGCELNSTVGKKTYTIADEVSNLPACYNAHNPLDRLDDPLLCEFPIVTKTPRVVTNDVSTKDMAWRNVNRASRNLVQAMAIKAREQGIYVFTLGLGSGLRAATGADSEKGEDLLKCMANKPGSFCYNAQQPKGEYCYAATEADLSDCFSVLASAVMRITK